MKTKANKTSNRERAAKYVANQNCSTKTRNASAEVKKQNGESLF